MTTKFKLKALILTGLAALPGSPLMAQGATGNQVLNWALIGIAGILVFLAVMSIADNMLQIEAKKSGVKKKGNFSLFPDFSEWKSANLPDYVDRASAHVLKDGHDIKLEGKIEDSAVSTVEVTRYSINPMNWRGIRPIPKVVVEVGDDVKAGDVLFYDKEREDVKFVAPVSGEIIEINRAAKRAIADIVILADKEQQSRAIPQISLASVTREELVAFLKEYGGWPLLNQRPFDVLAEDIIPENVFISTFDTAPLAPDMSVVMKGKGSDFQAGLNVLNKLTSGKVYLGLDARKGRTVDPMFADATGVEQHWFSGAHPAGNVGVQIHHINNIGRGEKVWTLKPADVAVLGALINRQVYDTAQVVALTGGELSNPQYVKTYKGAHIGELLKSQDIAEGSRIIAGNVLWGEATATDGYLKANCDQITVIKEGTDYEMFGWLVPQSARPSTSGTFPNFLFPDMEFEGNTNTHGEPRAFVESGKYENMLPMDIYVQHLCRAVMANDFERMEGLGIYELSEEDVALCEFSCTSKVPVTQIVRKGLNLMQEQV